MPFDFNSFISDICQVLVLFKRYPSVHQLSQICIFMTPFDYHTFSDICQVTKCTHSPLVETNLHIYDAFWLDYHTFSDICRVSSMSGKTPQFMVFGGTSSGSPTMLNPNQMLRFNDGIVTPKWVRVWIEWLIDLLHD